MQVTVPEDLLRQARQRAADAGVSLAEYIRRLLAADTARQPPETDVAELFDLGGSGGSDVARHEDAYLAAAYQAESASRPAGRS